MKMKPFEMGKLLGGKYQSYYNGKYQVIVFHEEDGSRVLSIRREDRKAIMDWRDMQWIKNQILGPEVEAVQLFPAESRLVDTSNQYYLFSNPDPDYRFPFGFQARAVTEKIRITTDGKNFSQQRPFADHVKPGDLEENEAMAAEMIKDLT
jgi:hypothetical protein